MVTSGPNNRRKRAPAPLRGPVTGPRILRLSDVVAKTGLPTSTLYLAMAEGKFPKPIPISSRSVGWLSDEIDGWIAACRCKRDGA
jgi:prophage regulatory protein